MNLLSLSFSTRPCLSRFFKYELIRTYVRASTVSLSRSLPILCFSIHLPILMAKERQSDTEEENMAILSSNNGYCEVTVNWLRLETIREILSKLDCYILIR